MQNLNTDVEFGSSIGYQLRKTYRMTEFYIQMKLSRHNIQIGMWYFLRVLWIEDGLTQRELSQRVGATEPTTLEQLRKMEKRGLIERRRDVIDRRKTIVLLTAEGKKLKSRLLRYVDDLNAVAFRGFKEQEISDLLQCHHRVRENLRKEKICSS